MKRDDFIANRSHGLLIMPQEPGSIHHAIFQELPPPTIHFDLIHTLSFCK